MATIWGGPAYVEFAVRSWRLIKKENFFRPLGTNSRWAFDISHWIFSLTIGAITAFLIIGSAPHIVWLRVLSMPGPSILYCLGGCILLITIYSELNRPAPFRISSTAKGGKVLPGVYYLMEDIVAVNAGAGRPFREALASRYKASPRFRRMIRVQSWFWSVPALVVAIVCTVLIVIHPIDKAVAYGIGKPFSAESSGINLLTSFFRVGRSFCMGWYLGCHFNPMDKERNAQGERNLGARLWDISQ